MPRVTILREPHRVNLARFCARVREIGCRARLVLFLLCTSRVRHSVKSLPTPVANARKNFSDIVQQARGGQRIKLTRHGKNVAWIIGASDREVLTTRTKRRRPKGASQT
jgi:prevent-host-death family protein